MLFLLLDLLDVDTKKLKNLIEVGIDNALIKYSLIIITFRQ